MFGPPLYEGAKTGSAPGLWPSKPTDVVDVRKIFPAFFEY